MDAYEPVEMPICREVEHCPEARYEAVKELEERRIHAGIRISRQESKRTALAVLAAMVESNKHVNIEHRDQEPQDKDP